MRRLSAGGGISRSKRRTKREEVDRDAEVGVQARRRHARLDFSTGGAPLTLTITEALGRRAALGDDVEQRRHGQIGTLEFKKAFGDNLEGSGTFTASRARDLEQLSTQTCAVRRTARSHSRRVRRSGGAACPGSRSDRLGDEGSGTRTARIPSRHDAPLVTLPGRYSVDTDGSSGSIFVCWRRSSSRVGGNVRVHGRRAQTAHVQTRRAQRREDLE